MYLYNIGYGSYDESQDVQMWHRDKLSNQGLEQKVQIASINALNFAVKNQDKFFFDKGISFEDLFDRVIIELKKLGFVPVKFTARFGINGFHSIVGLEEDEWERDPVLARLRKSIPDALKNTILMICQKILEERQAIK